MDENKPRRSWLSFGTRDLLWATLLLGIALGGWWQSTFVAESRLVERRAEAIRAETQLATTKAENENILRQIRSEREQFLIEKGVLVD